MESNINNYLRIGVLNHIIFILLVPQNHCSDPLSKCNGVDSSGLFLSLFILLQVCFEFLVISSFLISISSKTQFKATQVNTVLFLMSFFLAFNAVF